MVRITILTVLTIAFLGLLLGTTTNAFFTDSAVSDTNTFTAATTFPTATPSASPTPIASCSTTTGATVVINEINWVGSNGDGLDEWVELCNTTQNAIDISNWVITNLGTGNGPGADITIPSGKTIPANGFFLISAASQSASRINVPSDYVTSNISLSNGGEQLVLKNNNGVTVDIANGTGAWLAGSNSTPKKTMERKSPVGNGTQAASWQTATTHTNMDGNSATDEFGTPKAINGL